MPLYRGHLGTNELQQDRPPLRLGRVRQLPGQVGRARVAWFGRVASRAAEHPRNLRELSQERVPPGLGERFPADVADDQVGLVVVESLPERGDSQLRGHGRKPLTAELLLDVGLGDTAAVPVSPCH